ncbi:hypothetical protein PHMEG_0004531 [Phytophthora megakarya]|uniref:Uncharacterized protein n=1 Tax=Phytophthora megakarya TaxID=4795 RepID=A0A225WTL3_9STRA|nr:hypothetical protein PHMEG_0004531 [Phytophthora megakarya]
MKLQSTKSKPYLTENNKLRRIEFTFAVLEPDSLRFEPTFNMVHVDEKWFYKDTNKRSCIAFEHEKAQRRCRVSKNYIPKTMFLAAVAKPRQRKAHVSPFDVDILAADTADGGNIRLLFQHPFNTLDLGLFALCKHFSYDILCTASKIALRLLKIRTKLWMPAPSTTFSYSTCTH